MSTSHPFDSLPVVAFLFLRRRLHAAHVVVVPRGEFYGMIDQEDPNIAEINCAPLERFHALARRYGEIDAGLIDTLVEVGRTEGRWGQENIWTKFFYYRFGSSELADPPRLASGAELVDVSVTADIKAGSILRTLSGKEIRVDFTVPIAQNVAKRPVHTSAFAFA